MEEIDLLIHARWIIPVEPAGATLENHCVAVDAGRITAILPERQARERYTPRSIEHLDQHVLIPGLVNLHTHAAMTLLRGIADDLPLMRWLTEHIWPAEGAHISHRFVHDGTLLACAEMLKGGITCFSDMYFHPLAAAEAVEHSGIRAMLGLAVLEFPTPYAVDADDYLTKGLAAHDALRERPRISTCLAPHAPYTVSDHTFTRILTLAEQLGLPIHLHVHETRGEIEDSLRQHGMRPIERLRRLGLINPSLIAVHAVHLDAHEIDLMAHHGTQIAHCPASNLKLASGIAPLADWIEHGITVGLGTDGAASNNRLDLLREMYLAALLAKGQSGNAANAPSAKVLEMATLSGAKALGLGDEIGSIVIGKAADLCALSLENSELRPYFDVTSHVVNVLGRENVSHVWVDGRLCVHDGNLLAIDEAELKNIASIWQTKIKS